MPDFRILHLSDLHLFRNPEADLYGVRTRETLARVVQHTVESGVEFDHVVITGDHTHDELPDSYQAARGLLEPWLDRLSIVPGNHDDRHVMRDCLGDVIRRQQPSVLPDDDRIVFSFRCGSLLCVGMDTHLPGEVPGHFGKPQADWLRNLLTEYGDAPSLLFCHHPPVSVNSPWMDRIGLQDADLLLDVVADFPHIKMIVCGHVHHDSTGKAHHAAVVTTPSTGLQFDPRGEEPSFSDDSPGYRVIEITGEDVQSTVVRVDSGD